MKPTLTIIASKWYNKQWLVFLLCLLFFPVGLYGLWKSQVISKGWKTGVTVIIGALIVAGISNLSLPTTATALEKFDDTVSATAKKTYTSAAAMAAQPQHLPNGALFESPGAFRKRFNNVTAENKIDLHIDDLEISEGKGQNTFQYAFNKELGIAGSVEKETNNVKVIMIMGPLSNLVNVEIAMGAMIATADPDLGPNNRVEIFKQLGLEDKKPDLSDYSKSIEYNGMKYALDASTIMGIVFTISRK